MCLTPGFLYFDGDDTDMPPLAKACWFWGSLASRPFLAVGGETASVLLPVARALFCAPPWLATVALPRWLVGLAIGIMFFRGPPSIEAL